MKSAASSEGPIELERREEPPREDVWPLLVPLGKVCAINPRREPGLDRADDAPTSFVPMSAVDDRSGTIRNLHDRPFCEVRKGYTYFEDGDVIFAKITPCMQNGKQAVCEGLRGGFGFGSTEFHVIRPGPAVAAKWVHYFVRRPDILDRAVHAFTGSAGQQRLPESFLQELKIPLPPLVVQERIAARLTEQLAIVERARAAAAERLAAAEALPRAFLRKVFGRAKNNGWNSRRIGEICNLLPSKSIASSGDAEVRAITTACLTEFGFSHSGIKTARMHASDVAACTMQPGEVLIARSNTPELVGRASLYPGGPEAIVASDLTIRLWARAGDDSVLPSYLATYMSFLFQTGYWKERAGGASRSMKKITRTQLSAEVVPLPPMETQRRIAAGLADRISSAGRLARELRAELAAIDALPAALLRSAFGHAQPSV
ncbi:MAG TPA: restriction endonuclease subunit S [Phycisphaerae bacterium]|nr:restriction endonuclease subunit S [Phycisphaerae bacterium]